MKHSTSYQWAAFPAFLKRLADVFVSLCVLFLFSPFFIILAIMVLFTAGWPIIYSQERVGRNGKPFRIYKYRTMAIDAESDGPQLSSDEDERVVGLGRKLRKWRLDELPQFFNVLIGDMSIVGPRPERQFYVSQLKDSVPEYESIFAVRPGITSSGMVNFGYASTVNEMKERAPFDINYVKKLSLSQDIKLILQTVKVVIDGSGK